jgi:hypothetical protein
VEGDQEKSGGGRNTQAGYLLVFLLTAFTIRWKG